MADAELRGRRRSRRGARGATRRSACAPRRICSPATSTGPPPLFAESSAAGGRRSATPTRSSSARPSSRCWRWIAGDGRRRPSTWSVALAAIDEHRMHDYATSVLAFAAAARLAVHRGDLKEADRQLTRAMRARPSCTFVLPFLAVRVRLQLAKVYWAIGDHGDRPSPAAGDRRHPAPPAGSRRPRRRGRGASPGPHLERAGGERPAGRPSRPAELRLLPVPADAPHDPRDRRAAVRLPQHRQLRGRLDLPKARRLVTQRRGAAGDGDRPARRVADVTQPDWCSRASSMSYPSASASFGAAATTHGQPDDGNDADQHVDDLGGRRARTHRGIGLRSVGRDRATDRDQRGEPDQRQRLRIELPGLERRPSPAPSAKRASLMARQRSRSV